MIKPLNCIDHKKCFSPSAYSWNLKRTIRDRPVILGRSLMNYKKILGDKRYHKDWNILYQGIESEVKSSTILSDILHLLLNPEKELRKLLLSEKQRLYHRPIHVGLQLRMGGNIADSQEQYHGIPPTRLPQVIKQVDDLCTSKGWNYSDVSIYVSSDSTAAISMVSSLAQNRYEVVSSTLFSRGHSGRSLDKSTYVQFMKTVIFDIYFLTDCDYFFVSWQSSLGRMICDLVGHRNCDAVLKYYSTNKFVPFPS